MIFEDGIHPDLTSASTFPGSWESRKGQRASEQRARSTLGHTTHLYLALHKSSGLQKSTLFYWHHICTSLGPASLSLHLRCSCRSLNDSKTVADSQASCSIKQFRLKKWAVQGSKHFCKVFRIWNIYFQNFPKYESWKHHQIDTGQY